MVKENMKKNEDRPIIYITRDIERASGMVLNDNYEIINNNPGEIFDTAELLEQDKVRKQINNSGASVLVFKSTSIIESICKKNGWNLLNPSAELVEKYESKITQVEWLGDLAKYLPPHSILPTKEVKWSDKSFVLQWAHGHTGDGTLLIDSEEKLKDLCVKFPDRIARITDYVNGPSFTVNVVVAPNNILMGNISYQITGLPPFTDNLFSTVGNDWGIVHSLLNENEIVFIERMTRGIGEKMCSDGWKGLFGVDIIRDDESDKIFLIEINARQPASATFESQLQKMSRGIFEAHLLALQNKTIVQPLIKINDGAQVIQRITNKIKSISNNTINSLKSAGYNVIYYPNTEMNSDLLRIQSIEGILETHNVLNIRGEEIKKIISNL